MKLDKNALLLYLVTDRHWAGNGTLYAQVKAAIDGGVTFVQFREKNSDTGSCLQDALKIQALCRQHNIPFVINDNVELAQRIDADGVHIGQNDMNITDARRLLGENKIIGISAQNVEQAVAAERCGADYLGVGAIFHTDSKSDADDVGVPLLTEICSSVKIPVTAIGGINENNVLQLASTGICGIAVISAILASNDIQNAAKRLKELIEKVVYK